MRKVVMIGILLAIVTHVAAQQTETSLLAVSPVTPVPKKPLFKFYTLPNFAKTKSHLQVDAAPTNDKTYLDFVGTGDIQKAVSSGQDLNANTGAGIIFERYTSHADLKNWFQSLEVEMSINIATTSDSVVANVQNSGGINTVTNQRDFGSYMINPQSGKQAIFMNANVYFGYPDDWFGKLAQYINGVNFRFIGSNNVWSYADPQNASNSFSQNVGAYMLRVGIFHDFLPDGIRVDQDTKRTKYALFLGVNYSMRGLVGDLTSNQNSAKRMELLGTDKTTFNGLEFNTGFRLNNLRLEFQIPVLSAGRSIQVPGLTNTQFLFTIRFVGGFGLEINPTQGASSSSNN